MSKCLITGTFDPPTLGHEAIIERALAVFDCVIVAVLVNPDKETMFSLQDRIEMLRLRFGKKVEVLSDPGWAVDVAKKVGADVLVRGIRGDMDLVYEEEMAAYNRAHGVETLFFFAEEEVRDISSTKVRFALCNGECPEDYLSEEVARFIASDKGEE